MATERNPILHKTDWAEGSKPLPNLPYEINVEILLRLPVKSLLRFRCACKSWRSLISDPKFAKTHLSLAFSNTDYNHDRLLLSIRSGVHHPLDLKSCSISAIMYEQSHPAVNLDCPYDGPNLDCPYDGPPDWFWIQGSCNGLVCITTQNQNEMVILLNPSTRKSRRLPKVGMLFYEHTKYELACHSVFSLCRCPVYGFGYDESIDDYKVVVILKVQVNRGERQNRAAVYTLRTDSWRRIGDCPHPFELIGPGKFASGALHWIPSFGSKEIIVSLDLATETYGEVPQPECVHSYRNLIMDVFGGCLRVLCDCEGKGVELWVMKEYGKRESWTKLFAIHDNIGITPPICIFKNGDITTEVCLVRYNSKDGEFCYPMIHKCCPSSSVCSYIESLVSLDNNADTGV